MADPSSRPPSRPETPAAKSARDFGGLSRRIAGWTTNGLATALIVLAGLTLGRQVLLWWGEQPVPAQRPSQVLPHEDNPAIQLEFGTLGGPVQTRMATGTRAEVLSALRAMCRPASRPDPAAGLPATDAERKVLASLALQEPAESGDGWRIDQLPHGMPLVICSTTAGKSPRRPEVLLDLRIVAVGLAIPAEDGRWSAYAFRLDHTAPAPGGEAHFPLPADAIRGLTLRQPDGTALTAFRGQESLTAWEEHFATRPPQSGWQLRRQSALQGRRHLEFENRADKMLRAEVHFEYDERRELHGVLLVGPAESK